MIIKNYYTDYTCNISHVWDQVEIHKTRYSSTNTSESKLSMYIDHIHVWYLSRYIDFNLATSSVFRELQVDLIPSATFGYDHNAHSCLILKLLPQTMLAGTIAEQVMVLENIGTSVLVSENQVSCCIIDII